MSYAIYSLTSQDGLHEIKYGKNFPGLPDQWAPQGVTVTIIERCPTLKAASASLGLRNLAVKSMTKLIDRCVKAGAPRDLIDTLQALRDADGSPYGLSAVERLNDCRSLVAMEGVALPRQSFDDWRGDFRIEEKRLAYEKAARPRPGSIDAMTPEERQELRDKMRAQGWEPKF